MRFHPDEAFFAAFARNAAVRGEWLFPGDLDKTPLAIYLQSLGMLAFGIQWDGAVWRLEPYQGEFAARLVTTYISLLLVAVTVPLARALRLTTQQALQAMGWVALSPYTIAFSPTAFTDTPLLLFAMMSLLTAYRGHAGWAGFWLVLAYAAKQQALLFAPLVVVALGAASRPRVLWHFGITIAVGGALLAAWDLARPFPAVWALATANNAPAMIWVDSSTLTPRLEAWLNLGRWLFGLAGTTALLLLALVGLWGSRPHAKLGWLWAFVVGYLLLHLFVPLNIYDRYLLPLVPLIAIGVAATVRQRQQWLLALLVTVLMLPAAWTAAHIHPVVGGDKGQHNGIVELADYLNEREFGAIIYDRWLGWELNYYLGGWSDKRRAYYPSPWHLVTDPALHAPDPAPRYLPVPMTANPLPWRLALQAVGFRSCVSYQSSTFQVLALAHPKDPNAYSTWKTSCHNGPNGLE